MKTAHLKNRDTSFMNKAYKHMGNLLSTDHGKKKNVFIFTIHMIFALDFHLICLLYFCLAVPISCNTVTSDNTVSGEPQPQSNF